MDSRKTLGLVLFLLVLGLAGWFWGVPSVERRFRAEPVAAWIGVEIGGSGVARVGPIDLAAGKAFRLHAILEARKSDGDTFYFTDAPAVAFGEDEVAAKAVGPWQGPEDVRILWLTLEGDVPFRSLGPGEDLKRFSYSEFFHPEWGRAWSTMGGLAASRDELLEGDWGPDGRRFGTQHYQVWIELFADQKEFVPVHRIKSPGWEELDASSDRVARVVAQLPGHLSIASRAFGLSQLEPLAGSDEATIAGAARLHHKGLAFVRLLLLRSMIERSGADYASLVWRKVNLETGPPWSPSSDRAALQPEESVEAGDLLRVGARWVVLFRDEGDVGVLDGQDLCFDFDRGAEVRSLGDVFVGGGDIEWAALATPSPGGVG